MYTHTHTRQVVFRLFYWVCVSSRRYKDCLTVILTNKAVVFRCGPPPHLSGQRAGSVGGVRGGGQQERSSLTQIKDYFSPTTTTWWRWWWCATLTKLIHTVFPHQSETSHLLATVSSEANSPIKLNRKLFRKKKVIGPIEPITLRSKVKHSSRQQGAGLKPGAGLPSR